MMKTRTLLILGGTREAADIAHYAQSIMHLRVISSLAGRTARPGPLPGIVRHGGFGGVDAMRAYLTRTGVDFVIDASHPFASRISAHAAEACRGLDIELLRYMRPGWRQQAADTWHWVDDMEHAAQTVNILGRRIFLACGRKHIAAFESLNDHFFLVRLVEPPASALALSQYHLILAKGPFSQADERTLLREFAIDVVVSKYSGGESTYAKIAAARALKIPVVMVPRPAPLAGREVADLEQVFAWLEAVSKAHPTL